MKIAVVCGCLLSIAFAIPIPKGTQKKALEKPGVKQAADVRATNQDFQASPARAAEIQPAHLQKLEEQAMSSNPTEDNDEDSFEQEHIRKQEGWNLDHQDDETDDSYDTLNYRSSDETESDELDEEQDYENDYTYDTQNYRSSEESDDQNEAESHVFSDVKDDTKEQKDSLSPEANKDISQKKVAPFKDKEGGLKKNHQ